MAVTMRKSDGAKKPVDNIDQSHPWNGGSGDDWIERLDYNPPKGGEWVLQDPQSYDIPRGDISPDSVRSLKPYIKEAVERAREDRLTNGHIPYVKLDQTSEEQIAAINEAFDAAQEGIRDLLRRSRTE